MKSFPDQRMHSAEHILNQTMVRLYACDRSFTAHIGPKKSKCDYRFDHALSPEEVADIASRVNEVIQSDLPVTDSLVSLGDARRMCNTDKLPEHVSGKIRLVHIGDYDTCPCIGTHVPSTAAIGAFRITTTSFDAGILRIRFKLTP